MERHPTIGARALGIFTAVAIVFVLRFSLTAAPAGQAPKPAPAPPAPTTNCQPGQDLIAIPEIKSVDKRLRAELELTSGKRTLWGSVGDTRCVQQDIRYFTGRSLLTPGKNDPAFSRGEPIPGPTLRARVGDLIEVRFLNHVDPLNFANTLDRSRPIRRTRPAATKCAQTPG